MTINPNVVDPSGANSQTTPTVATISSPSTTPAAAPEGSSGGGVGTMSQLKASNPKLYDAMMKGIAMQICTRSQSFQRRMEKYAKEASKDD